MWSCSWLFWECSYTDDCLWCGHRFVWSVYTVLLLHSTQPSHPWLHQWCYCYCCFDWLCCFTRNKRMMMMMMIRQLAVCWYMVWLPYLACSTAWITFLEVRVFPNDDRYWHQTQAMCNIYEAGLRTKFVAICCTVPEFIKLSQTYANTTLNYLVHFQYMCHVFEYITGGDVFRVRTMPTKAPNIQYPIILASSDTQYQYWY